jgi:hypothetical protein
MIADNAKVGEMGGIQILKRVSPRWIITSHDWNKQTKKQRVLPRLDNMECSKDNSKRCTKDGEEDVGDTQEAVTAANGAKGGNDDILLASIHLNGEVCWYQDEK